MLVISLEVEPIYGIRVNLSKLLRPRDGVKVERRSELDSEWIEFLSQGSFSCYRLV